MNVAEVDTNNESVRLAEVDRNNASSGYASCNKEQMPESTAAAGSKRRWLSKTAGQRNLSSGQEEAFVNMHHLRKMNRALSGNPEESPFKLVISVLRGK